MKEKKHKFLKNLLQFELNMPVYIERLLHGW